KAMRVSGRGRPGRAARRRIATRRLSGGRVEHDGEEILSASLLALREAALMQHSADWDLGIATQRSTVLFWDTRTGRPLTPAYSWQDLRGASLCAGLLRSGRVDA